MKNNLREFYFNLRQLLKAKVSKVLIFYREIITNFLGIYPYLKYISLKLSKVEPKSRKKKPNENLRLAFVSTWFGENIAGGAENLCFKLTHAIKQQFPTIKVDVFTTSLLEFSADWNTAYHSPGIIKSEGIEIYRFSVSPKKREKFHWLNATKLLQGGTSSLKASLSSPLSYLQEAYFIDNMVASPDLLQHLKSAYDDYDFFIYLPYMFHAAVFGTLITGKKSVLIPCFHDERYLFLSPYRYMIKNVRAAFFNTKSELRLARDIFGKDLTRSILMGVQVEGSRVGDPKHFRDKYNIQGPFILYVGRIIEGKNVIDLLKKFIDYNAHSPLQLQLVIIGKGDIETNSFKDVINLGFLSEQDKCDALAAALFLCQPSLNESFSIVMMESWLQSTPVLVHEQCEVTKDHCISSGGGLFYGDQMSFNSAVDRFANDKEWRKKSGELGKKYVEENYSSKKITSRFIQELENLAALEEASID